MSEEVATIPRRFEMGVLFRRSYDGSEKIDKDAMKDLASSALNAAIDAFAKVVVLEDHPVIPMKIILGKRAKSYDQTIDAIAEPPYYMWARIMLEAEFSWVVNWPGFHGLERDTSGKLIPTSI